MEISRTPHAKVTFANEKYRLAYLSSAVLIIFASRDSIFCQILRFNYIAVQSFENKPLLYPFPELQ